MLWPLYSIMPLYILADRIMTKMEKIKSIIIEIIPAPKPITPVIKSTGTLKGAVKGTNLAIFIKLSLPDNGAR